VARLEKEYSMTQIVIAKKLIAETVNHLQDAGHKKEERVVLWLAVKNRDPLTVCEVFVPEQESSWGNFRIPRNAMMDLMRHLRTSRMFIAAQVHSHPFEAFHSPIDDEWAIVRHVGALSLVLPDFAINTFSDSFVDDTAVFKLSEFNKWEEVPRQTIPEHYLIVNEY
jgi:hypothetical protein